MADRGSPDLVASFFTLTGAGFGEPPRYSFAQRYEAAATAGFAGIGLHIEDLARTRQAGTNSVEMRALLRSCGLRLVEIEFVGGWALSDPDADPARSASSGASGSADLPDPLRRTLAEVEDVADALGGRHVSAGEFRGGAEWSLDPDAAASRLRAFAGRLAGRELLVAVEAFPWSAIPDVDCAVDLLRRAAAPNAGLMIDVWHFYNGGAKLDVLDDLPGAGVAAVQLNDGPLVDGDFLKHARAQRKLPGEGELDVVGLIRAVQATGYSGPYCVEVNTPEYAHFPWARQLDGPRTPAAAVPSTALV